MEAKKYDKKSIYTNITSFVEMLTMIPDYIGHLWKPIM